LTSRVYILLFHILSSLFIFDNSDAQTIDTTYTAQELVENILLGSGVVVGKVNYKGPAHAIGHYSDSSQQIDMRDGILLTSGNAYYALGPNKSPRTGWASNAEGDSELGKIARGNTYDASVLSFDFVTASENLSFEFVFASEEYLEYVGSKFNDVFAFFLTPQKGDKINIARLPDRETPITVNTVNNQLNVQYYKDNTYINTSDPFIWDVRNREVISNENYGDDEHNPPFNIQFDGFTSVLKAQAKVIPNQVYKIKIAIADVGDGILDSGVFLKGKSFKSEGDILVNVDDHFNKKIPVVEQLASKKASVSESLISTRSIPTSTAISFNNVEFEFDEYQLNSQALQTIDFLYSSWKNNPDSRILLRGHTDNFGSLNYNQDLSLKRAEAVKNRLLYLGVPKEKIKISFFGEERPIENNNNAFGRARNRRVEIELKN